MNTIAAHRAPRFLDMADDARRRVAASADLAAASAAEARLQRALRRRRLQWSALHEQLADVDRDLSARSRHLGIIPGADRAEAMHRQAALRVELAAWREHTGLVQSRLAAAASAHDAARATALGRAALELLREVRPLGGELRVEGDSRLVKQLKELLEVVPSEWIDQMASVRVQLVEVTEPFVHLARGRCVIGASSGTLIHQLVHMLISCLPHVRKRLLVCALSSEQLCGFGELLSGVRSDMDDQALGACIEVWSRA
jgi:hypothetical protein